MGFIREIILFFFVIREWKSKRDEENYRNGCFFIRKEMLGLGKKFFFFNILKEESIKLENEWKVFRIE